MYLVNQSLFLPQYTHGRNKAPSLAAREPEKPLFNSEHSPFPPLSSPTRSP